MCYLMCYFPYGVGVTANQHKGRVSIGMTAYSSFLTCSISPDTVVIPLSPDHKMWLASSSPSGEFICQIVVCFFIL